jgi:N-acetyl-anhydromuramyl-L-alanine amidase AmpD
MTPLWLTNLSRRVRQIFGSTPSGIPPEWSTLTGLTVDARGWLLGSGVTLMPSHPSWHYPKLSTPTGKPLALVCHYTSTNPGTALSMARRRMRKFGEDPDDRQASWHVSVEADGSIVQQVSMLAGTWHAGSPTAVPIKGAGWANRVAIGIELVGHGKVWPEAQVIGAARLWRALIDAYAIPRALAMVTHQELDPTRKSDPGKPWMRDHAPAVLEYAFAE